MNQKDAKDAGQDYGYRAGTYCEVSATDRREASCACIAPAVCSNCLTEAAYEAEQCARDFSPWEFTAHDINETGDRAADLWEAYDNGVRIGIRKAISNRITDGGIR